MELQIIYLLTFLLVILQTIVGVGVLVLGTPLLLILDYNIIEIMNLLLPISITTSLLNYLYLKYNKKKLQINLDKSIKKNFIIIFLPGMTIGLILIREFYDYINFETIVSLVIFLSLFIKWRFEKIIYLLPLLFKKIILILISIVHGLTNSGGTLLTIFFVAFNRDKKNQSRYSITFYYLTLVIVQYLIFLLVFKKKLSLDYPYQIILLIITATFVGNIIVKRINEKFFKRTIEILALFSALFLLINN
jgi:uncharacterized membrane protein YfcA